MSTGVTPPNISTFLPTIGLFVPLTAVDVTEPVSAASKTSSKLLLPLDVPPTAGPVFLLALLGAVVLPPPKRGGGVSPKRKDFLLVGVPVSLLADAAVVAGLFGVMLALLPLAAWRWFSALIRFFRAKLPAVLAFPATPPAPFVGIFGGGKLNEKSTDDRDERRSSYSSPSSVELAADEVLCWFVDAML